MHQEFEPPEELRDCIHCFWYDQRDVGAKEASFEVMPDGYAEIIFHFGNGCSILTDGVLQALPSPFMMGLLNKPAHFYTKGRFEIIAIRCYPWTVFDLLGLPSGKDAVRAFEHPIAELQLPLNDLVRAGEFEKAIASVMAHFLQARRGIATNSMLFKAGEAMNAASGNIPVSRVAAAAHATVRTLQRKFKQSAGHTVKDVSILMRFEQVRNTLWHDPECNLAGLAQELGYTDQAHLSREFNRYSGSTPAAFARKARQSKQTVHTDFVAFIQA